MQDGECMYWRNNVGISFHRDTAASLLFRAGSRNRAGPIGGKEVQVAAPLELPCG